MPSRLRSQRPKLGSGSSFGFGGTAKRRPPPSGISSLDRQIERLAGVENNVQVNKSESFADTMSRLVVKPVQTKSYDLSAPSDPAEREADTVAEQVMQRLGGDNEQRVGPIRTSLRATIHRDRERSPRVSTPDSFASSLNGPRTGGQPLPTGFRRNVEGAMGRSFADVRIHSDPKANDLSSSIQAKAFTNGSHIYFGRGQYRPEHPSGQHLLAHELTHVAQQRGSSDSRKIHRTITVGDTEYSGWRIRGNSSKQLLKAWRKIKASNYTPTTKWGREHLNRLQLWVSRETKYNMQIWMTIRDLEFNNWEEAAQALDAEVEAQANRRLEKRLAKTAKASNPKIAVNLAKAMTKIGTWITQAFPGQVSVRPRGARVDSLYPTVWHWLEVFHGQYDHFYDNGHIKSRMMSPTPKRVSTNFAILREIVYALGNINMVGHTETDTAISAYAAPRAYDGGARYGSSSTGKTRVDKTDGETREGWTMKGSHDWVKHARAKKMPLRAGASNTTDRLLQMAGKAGCGAQGKQAIAWGGFIFWNKKFYTHHSPGHTFHEVMDVANVNHGVAYDVDSPYGFEEAKKEKIEATASVPDYSTMVAVVLLDKTTPPPPLTRPVDTNQFAKIPSTPVLGRPTFVDGKTIAASKELDGSLDRTITFVTEPSKTDNNQLPLKMFKVICSPAMRSKGRAQLQPAGFGDRAVYVQLADLFDLKTGDWNLN